ncbi:hypothetical protein BH23BAC1_BH23BAC1_38610 [soil metagenome]
MIFKSLVKTLLIVLLFLHILSGCTFFQKDLKDVDIGVVINISERMIYVFQEGNKIKEYPIAVGQQEYPTPVGNYKIHRIDWNPDWNPPDSDWSEKESYTPPGNPNNPMGRVRMVYQAPYSIHGTEEVGSLGKAASHGSVRMANEDIIELAQFLLEASGDRKSKRWVDKVISNPEEMVQVNLSKPIPLTNQP